MNKVLYKDNEFELAIDDTGLYLCINNNRYELSSNSYEPCTYIKTKNGNVDIVMHDAFDFGTMISSSGEWTLKTFSPLRLCEILKTAILKDKAQKKQQIVEETRCKTACKTNILPILCPCCKKRIWINDTIIPNGEKYEVLCDNCKISIIRKKIDLNPLSM